MAARTSAQSGSGSSGSVWVGGVAPTTGDTVVIAAGHTVHIDSGFPSAQLILGSNSANVGDAFDVLATDQNTYGSLIIDAGCTLQVRGTVATSNRMGRVRRYAQLTASPGSTFIGDLASNGQSLVKVEGQAIFQGTSGSHITVSSPPGSVSWANQLTNEAYTNKPATQYAFRPGSNIACAALSRPWVANSGGSAGGSFGNTSLSFSAQSPGTILQTEVASLAAVTSAGKYYVNYDIGCVYFYHTYSGNVTFQATYKYLTLSGGWHFDIISATTHNSGVFEYCDFTYMGSATQYPALRFANKLSAGANGGATNRLARVTSCTFTNCHSGILIDALTGTADDYLLFEDNTFSHCLGSNISGPDNITNACGVNWATGESAYCSFSNNALNMRNQFFFIGASAAGLKTMTSFRLNNLTGIANSIFRINDVNNNYLFPDLSIQDCTVDCTALLSGQHIFIRNVQGTAGHPAVIRGNTFNTYLQSGIRLQSFVDVEDNIFGWPLTYALFGAGSDHHLLTTLNVRNNLFNGKARATSGTGNAQTPAMYIGSDHPNWFDRVVVENNTFAGGSCGLGFGHPVANSSGTGMFNASFANNLARNCVTGAPNSGGFGFYRSPTQSANKTTCHFLVCDNNAGYGNETANYSGISRGSTFSLSGSNYNTLSSPSRNVTGASLHSPSYSTTQTGRSLVYTATSLGVDETVSWGGGTAVQMVFDNGTISTGASQDLTNGVTGLINATLTDSTKAWSTNRTLATCPVGCWVKITSGAAAGYFGYVSNCTATTLTVSPSFANPRSLPGHGSYTAPSSGASYVLYKSEITLTDSSTGTVSLGLDMRVWPTTSQTDSGITMTTNDQTADPLLVGSDDDSQTAADYIHSALSPLVNAGQSYNAPSTDYFGNARPAAVDIGFYELPSVVTVTAGVALVTVGGIAATITPPPTPPPVGRGRIRVLLSVRC